jgi:alpha-1,2-glucosyltransferase
MDALVYFCYGVVAMHHTKPYMDEVFHVPMVEKYLEGRWMEWDNKITTFPGVYVIMVGILKAIQVHKGIGVLMAGRGINCLSYGVFNSWFPVMEKNRQDLILLLPPLFFTSFLFYTDTLATITVLISWKLIMSNRHYLSALMGGVSVLCRQTNIIWLAAFVLSQLIYHSNSQKLSSLLKYSLKNLDKILSDYIFHILIGIGFCIFVIYNGGIVVGDKAHHTPVLHISQIFYLSLILSLYLPLDTSSFSKSLKSVSSLLGIFLVCICGYCIKYYSYEHPFLLSDNTHYTFYLWRYLKTVNIYLSPIYSISLFYLYHRLSTKPLIFLTWLLCSILVLVPAQLIEPRYFIMPMIFYILHDSKRPSKLRIAALAVLNIGTVVMFAWRPYKGIAFMW